MSKSESGMTYEEAVNYNAKVSKQRQAVLDKIAKNKNLISAMEKKIGELNYQNHKLDEMSWDGSLPFEVHFDNIPEQLKPKIQKYRVIKHEQSYLVDGKWCGISYPMNAAGDGPDEANPRFYVREYQS